MRGVSQSVLRGAFLQLCDTSIYLRYLGVRGVAPCCHPPPKNAQIGSALAAASATDEATAIRLDRGRPLGRYSYQTSLI